MSDMVVSLIRTYVPIILGSALTWLASRTGVVVNEDSSAALIAGTVGLVSAIWYAAARLLEKRWPHLGVLLGTSKQPQYADRPERTDAALQNAGRQ